MLLLLFVGRRFLNFLLVGITSIIFVNCSPYAGLQDTQVVRTSTTQLSDHEIEKIFEGRELFEKNCMGCHGTIETTKLKFRTVEQIITATDNVEAMNTSPSLQVLRNDPEKLEAIAAALNHEGPVACTDVARGRTPLHHLSRREVINTLRDLLNVTNINAQDLPLDGENSMGFDNDSSSVTLSTFDIDKIYGVMEWAVTTAFANGLPEGLGCQRVNSLICTDDVIRNLLTRIFRRLPTTEEVEDYSRIANNEPNANEGLKKATLMALMSPHFYFLVIDDSMSIAEGTHSLNDFELASRLSYLIWSSAPDEQLLNLAAQNRIRENGALKQQIVRMLADPRSQDFRNHFFATWLKYDRLDDIVRDNQVFPAFNELKGDLKKESETFVAQLIANNHDISDLFYGNYTFVNKRLSDFYELDSPATSDTEFVRTSLVGTPRMGVLTHPGIITAINGPVDHSSPIHRGIAIYEKFFCGSFGEAPSVAAEDTKELEILTVKEGLNSIRRRSECASCHNVINPVGLAFENFDAIGQWRTTYDNGLPVDSSDLLADGRTVNGPIDLLKKMGEGHKLEKCLTRNVVTYATTRMLKSVESCQVDNLLSGKGSQPLGIVELIEKIATSKVFSQQALDERSL